MRPWLALAALLAAGALAVALLARGAPLAVSTLDWQPGHGLAEPWRAWTAALVHGSPAHLAGNLVATALVAWLGARARATPADAAAWFVAWPLTQAGLGLVARLAPADYARWLPHYFGLSGVLHAGVVVLALSLCRRAGPQARRERVVGAALLAGTLVKVVAETPWELATRPGGWLGVAVAPVAHASGVAAGLLAFAIVSLASRVQEASIAARRRGPPTA